MKQHLVAYTSDVHGNSVQYNKLIDYCIKNNMDSLIIGGDITPKDFVFQSREIYLHHCIKQMQIKQSMLSIHLPLILI